MAFVQTDSDAGLLGAFFRHLEGLMIWRKDDRERGRRGVVCSK